MRQLDPVPCWTVVAGVVVQADSFKEMSRKVGIPYSSLYAAHRAYPGFESLTVAKRLIHFGYHDQKPDDNPKRTSGGPLLRGLVTHRLGVGRR